MKHGLRIPSFALGPKTASLDEMGRYLRRAEDFAKEWATLDLLSGGRSILGIGVGWHEEEFALMNVPYKERGPRMNEAIELGRDPAKVSRVYANFVWVLKPGEEPETAVPHFSVYSGMDLDYWKTYYLLGEAAEVADRISARIQALDGGVDTIVLNPLDWSLEQLELIAGEVLPRVHGAP